MDMYSLHIPYMGSGKCLTLVSWLIWWKNNTPKIMNFPLARQLNWSTLWPQSCWIEETRNPEVSESRTVPFSSCLLLHQLNCTLCVWLQEQYSPGQPRYSQKGQGLLQSHSAATSFMLVSTFMVHYMSQIWKVKCKNKSAILVEWHGPLHHTYCWCKRGKRDRNVPVLT